jgi:hypothetical protein
MPVGPIGDNDDSLLALIQGEIEASMVPLEAKLDRLIDDHFGAQFADIDGVYHREGGLRAEVAAIGAELSAVARDVTSLKTQSENGGIPAKVRLTSRQRAGLWTVAITAAGAVLVGLIQLLQAILV